MTQKAKTTLNLEERVVREEIDRARKSTPSGLSKEVIKLRLMSQYPEHDRGNIRILVNKIFREKSASTPQVASTAPTINRLIAAQKAGADNAKPVQTKRVNSQSQPTAAIASGSDKVSKDPKRTSQDSKTVIANKASPKLFSNPKVQELRAYIDALERRGESNSSCADVGVVQIPSLERQLQLLHVDDNLTDMRNGDLPANAVKEAILFSADLSDSIDSSAMPQFALLGNSVAADTCSPVDPRIFLNTNIPFSAFICGVQGSGKSHTTSCLIENCLIPSPALGSLKKPLSALVLHYGEYSSSLNFRPSEAAFLASPGEAFYASSHPLSVTVLVSPSNYQNLRLLYSQIPNVEVKPFKLQPEYLNIGTILALMSVDQTKSAPLYMGQVTKVLREMAAESAGSFNYLEFRRRLKDAHFDRAQAEFLNQRLDLLESFLDIHGEVPSITFNAGHVTIVDLTCPFMDSNTACVLFKISLGMYLGSNMSTGKVIVVDEAHKYMTDTPAAKDLTDCFLSIIRQQRHYGARVIISTQEPTISPRLIDLCAITVVHRFFSPEWFTILRKHIIVTTEGGAAEEVTELFQKISSLRTGEALVFAPSAILGGNGSFTKMADKTFRMMMRKRITWDGGRSVVCV